MTKKMRQIVNGIPSQELFLFFPVCLYKIKHIKNEAMRVSKMEKNGAGA